MGDIITLSRPPVAVCGECPHCPTPEVEDYTIFVKTSLSWDSGYGTGIVIARPLSATSTSTPYYLGIFARGRMGATLSLSLPIYQNSSATDYSFDDSASANVKLTLYGYFQIDLVIESDNVISTTSDGSYIAGFNATFGEYNDDFENVEIYTEIALPLPDELVFWYFVVDDSGSDESQEDEL